MLSLARLPLTTSVVLAVLHLVSLSGVALAQGVTIDTPNSLVQCLPTAITWHNAVPPVIIAAYPKGNIAASPYYELPTQQSASGSYTWKVNLPAGVATTIGIRDGSGMTQNAAPRVVQSSSSASACDLVKVPAEAYDSGSNSSTGTGTSTGGVTTVPTGGSGSTNSSSSGSSTPSSGVTVSNGGSGSGSGNTTSTTSATGSSSTGTGSSSTKATPSKTNAADGPVTPLQVPLAAMLTAVIGGALLV